MIIWCSTPGAMHRHCDTRVGGAHRRWWWGNPRAVVSPNSAECQADSIHVVPALPKAPKKASHLSAAVAVASLAAAAVRRRANPVQKQLQSLGAGADAGVGQFPPQKLEFRDDFSPVSGNHQLKFFLFFIRLHRKPNAIDLQLGMVYITRTHSW